jgi:hypothetical protein
LTLDEEKKLLFKEFNDYLTSWKDRIVSGGKQSLVLNEEDPRLTGLTAIYPSVAVFKGDTANSNGIILENNYVKPEYLTTPEYEKALKEIKEGIIESRKIKVPGFDQYYEALGEARNAGYKAVFHSYGASQYIKTKDEYKNYIDSLRDILGEDELNDLIADGYLTEPDLYVDQLINPADPGWKYTRTEQINYVAKMLYYRKKAVNIFKVLQSYRHIPSKLPAEKTKDKKHNDEVIKIYFNLQTEAKTEYGDAVTVSDANRAGWVAAGAFKGRYSESIFMTVIDVLYSLEVEMLELNSNYPRGVNGDYFKDLMEGDNELRRVRALNHILDKNKELKPGLDNKLWNNVLKNYNKFIEKSKSGVTANIEEPIKDPKEGEAKTRTVLRELTPTEYIDKILSYSNPGSFKAAISNMYPSFKVYRTETGGRVVPFFTWYPDPLTLQRIYILMAYEKNPKKVNDLISGSAKSPLQEGSASDEKDGGFIRKIFGERQGFKSSEAPTSLGAKKEKNSETGIDTKSNQSKIEKENRPTNKDKASASINSSSESGDVAGGESGKTSDLNAMTAGEKDKDLTKGSTSSSVINNDNSTTTTLTETQINEAVDNIIMKMLTGELSGGETAGSTINNESTSNLIKSEASSILSQSNESSINSPSKSSENTNVTQSTSNSNVINSPAGSNITASNNTSNVSGSNTQSNTNTSQSNAGVSSSSSSINTSIGSSNTKSNAESNTSNINNVSKETVAQSISVEKKGSTVSNVSSNVNQSQPGNQMNENIGSESMTGDLSNINNVNNESGGTQNNQNITNNSDNSMSKTPIIQNNIDLSEMNIRLKRIEEALLSPLEVKVISNLS